MTHNHEFTAWLDTATRDLPAEVAAMTRRELTAHYEDALEAYIEAGMSPAEAHQQAMTDLGAANHVANGLNDVHRGQKYYERGMVASAATLIILIGRMILHEALNLGLYSTESNIFISIGDVLLTLTTVYILLMLGRMLTWRFNQIGMDRIIQIIIAGEVISIACDVLYRHAIADELYVGTTLSAFDADTLPAALVIACSALARGAMGIGIILLARKVYAAAAGLYGLGKPLAMLLYCMGGALATIGLWTHLNVEIAAYSAEVITIFAHVLVWNLMILLFFRLAYRNPVHPKRFA